MLSLEALQVKQVIITSSLVALGTVALEIQWF